jgi:hypothetical protein
MRENALEQSPQGQKRGARFGCFNSPSFSLPVSQSPSLPAYRRSTVRQKLAQVCDLVEWLVRFTE